jgi:zinc transport system substrate-binding protein
VVGEVKETRLLLDGSFSPHDYYPSPGDMRKIRNADLLFAIGSDFETFLKKHQLNKNVIFVADKITLPLLLAENDHHDNHGHYDLHLWVSPLYAVEIVNVICDAVSDWDPSHKEIYHNNAQIMIDKLRQLDEHIAATLAPYKNINFFVLHNAYTYFERSYELKAIPLLLPNFQHFLSARKLEALSKLLKQSSDTCVFIDQYTPSKLVTFFKNTGAKVSVLDTEGNADYIDLMEKLVENMVECFTR